MNKLRSLLIIPMVFAPVCGVAHAENLATDSWEHELTPYLWATRMKGDVATASLPNTHVDMRFSDILENLDMGFMSAFESRKGRWSVLFDGMYMNVSDSATTNIQNVSVHAHAQVKQTSLTGAVGYRAIEGDVPVDVLAGLRFSRINVDADIDAALFGLSGSVSRSGSKSWTEPYVGVKINIPMTERLKAVAYGDLGGFGVGSDLTWQAMLGLSYAYSKSISMNIGYRYLDVDYDKDGFKYKMVNDGIYTGVSFRF